MSAHLGRTATYKKIAAGFFWYGIHNDVADYMQKCDSVTKSFATQRKK